MSAVIHFAGGETIVVEGTPQSVVDFLVQGKKDDEETWAHMDLEHGTGPVAIKVAAVTHIVSVPESAG